VGFTSLLAQYPDDPNHPYDPPGYPRHTEYEETVQIALILDVSGSMDGLLAQAKSQLWHIVNGIMWSYDRGRAPRLELSLYAYGQQSAGYRAGYLRQLLPFTTDLDWVSETLFGLYAEGRYEYAGVAIQSAVEELRWSRSPSDLKMIYIAGNEPFEQGPVRSEQALRLANRRGIVVNTIYCGEDYKGRREGWTRAAQLGQGDYFNIDPNRRQNYDRYSPYDHQLLGLNRQLNSTYVPYGRQASRYQQRQQTQDQRAYQLGQGIASQRVITKASPAYRQPEWDLVDAVATGAVQLENIAPSDLPPAMQGMSRAQQKRYLAEKAQARRAIRGEIQQLTSDMEVREKRKIQVQGRPGSSASSSSPRPSGSKPQTLDQAIIESAVKQRKQKRQPRVAPRQSLPTTERRPDPVRPWPSPERPTERRQVRPQPAPHSHTAQPAPDRRAPQTRQRPSVKQSSARPTVKPAPPSQRPARSRPSVRPAPQRPAKANPAPSRPAPAQRSKLPSPKPAKPKSRENHRP